MHALIAVAALAAAQPMAQGPIMASAERVLARMDAKGQVSQVPGFEDIKKFKREGFFSPTNLLTGAALGAAAAYDVHTTFETLGLAGVYVFPQPDGSTRTVTVTVREKTAFYLASVHRGDRGGVWRRKAAVNVPMWVGSHFLRRSRFVPFRVAGYILPALAGGIQVGAGWGNQREAKRIRAMLH